MTDKTKEDVEETTVEENEVVDDQDESTEETNEESTKENTEDQKDYKKLYEEEAERTKKWKARAKKGKAKAKAKKESASDIDIDELVEKKIKAVREKDSFTTKYPEADIEEVSELAEDMGISYEEAHILNEHRNWRTIVSSNHSTTWVHGSFKSNSSKDSDIRKKLENAVPGFMVKRETK